MIKGEPVNTQHNLERPQDLRPLFDLFEIKYELKVNIRSDILRISEITRSDVYSLCDI